MRPELRLGIMQPYFFPYAGHFALIAAVDEWIVFDITQYTPKTWMNRNRVLHPKEGWQYLSVPLAQSSIHIRTADARLQDPAACRASLLGKIEHYRRRAPYFAAVRRLLEQAFDTAADRSLVQLNVAGLGAVCAYLGIPFRHRIASALGLDLPPDLGAGDWAPEIAGRLGATGYINPDSGRALFDTAAFASRGIALQFAQWAPLAYEPAAPYRFEPHLSILDVLMWLPPDRVRAALRDNLTLLPG